MIDQDRAARRQVRQLERDLDLLVPAGRESSKDMKPIRKDGCFGKGDFTYDDSTDRYRCPAGRALVVIERSRDPKQRAITKYAANAADCADRKRGRW